MGENIGAAARVMMNFGLEELRIVQPRDGWPNEKARAMAADAVSLVDAAGVYEDLADAVADLQDVFAVTARLRDMVKPVLLPEAVAEQIWKKAEQKKRCGFVFGPEKSGLSNKDVVQAQAVVTIPANPSYPSLNLAQAVAVISYAWSQAGREEVTAEMQEEWATRGDVEGFLQQLEAALDKTAFFRVEEKRERMVQHIQNIFQRMELTEREVRILRGIVKALGK